SYSGAATRPRTAPQASRSSSPRSASRSTNASTIPATSTSARSTSSFRTSVSSRSKGPSKASRSSSSSRTTTSGRLTALPDAAARDRHRRAFRLAALAASPADPARPLLAAAQELPPDEERGRADEDEDRDPGVQRQPRDVVRRVDPQQLLEEAPGRVVRDVEREERRRLEPEAPVEQQQQPDADEVVDELVQEGRVEGRVALVAGDAVLRVDLQPPR